MFNRVLRHAALLIVLSSLMVALQPTASVRSQDLSIEGTVWVADENGNSITVIDASTIEVVTTLTGIEGPHNLQVSPDGATVWAISGHDNLAVQIDARTYAVLGTTPTGEHPAHIITTSDGSTVYVTNGGDNSVTVIDAATKEVITTIPVGEFPHGLRPSPDGRWIYVANANDTTLSVIDTTTNERVTDVEVGERPVQVAFDPNGEYVYFSLNGENAVGKVDVATQSLVGTVEVGDGPIQVYVTPDNRYVLTANQGTEENPSTTVSIIDVATFAVVETLETGQGAHGVVVEPSGRYAYITNIYGDDVAVIDLSTLEVVARVATGDNPNGISFSPLPAAPAQQPQIALALDQDTEADHDAHHPTSEVIPTVVPEATESAMGQMDMDSMDMSAMMQPMMDMMDEMMSMEMSADMMSMMQQMRGMMDMMSGGGMADMMGGMEMSAMMRPMMNMMDEMMGMEMSADMMSMMQQMRGMMDMMMSMMSGMEMGDTDTDDHSGQNGEGMDMGAGGHDTMPISSEGVPAATDEMGGQPLEYTLDDGVKVFQITARPVLWNILEDVTVTAWTYNGTVPGPMIRVTEGDRVRVVFTNELPEATTVHFHGNTLTNAMDGVPNVTQNPVEPGETFVYEFTASPSGTFWYHSHLNTDTQIGLGLYAPLIIDPAQPETTLPDVDVTLMLSEWRVVDGLTYPSMPMAGAEPNYFTINGRAFPATEPINVQVGQRVRIRFINAGQFVHPMHTHGTSFQIVATDGYPVPAMAQLTKDTVAVAPGERYDIEFIATEPGMWAVHCHVLHHVTNDGEEPGGLTIVVNIVE
ncbi:multicopper oxidase domain-containing protein [Oscillatoria laete-virens NRMC-F 0139]|nr:multicopper oxidase domain-containing protein [Oscillatoria laete-virens]MDL5054993.1 multicopper oxidase domain-containing protein [Oscillatoria laete-virens NRMC-F 0139]